MKYQWTSRVDVYDEADWRLPRVNLFRGRTVKCGREENKFSHDRPAPNHTTVSGASLRVTSSQRRSGPRMKRERSALPVSEAQELELLHFVK